MAPRIRRNREVNARWRREYVATTRLTLDSTTAQTMCATSFRKQQTKRHVTKRTTTLHKHRTFVAYIAMASPQHTF